ncbi:hypothetical protein P7K49_001443 [Saguinus oedipus]|uniref:Uncharacterized protein n=1 Tax=Saguinus oedipus TaxID=9490 RepID=A0ABQ9WEH1_SAGOE|nr:hypothetical protein P7K49_001443 [Saguinus oedipus]
MKGNPPANLNMATSSSLKKNPGNKGNGPQEPPVHLPNPPGLDVPSKVSLEPVKGVSRRQCGILEIISNAVQLKSSQDSLY